MGARRKAGAPRQRRARKGIASALRRVVQSSWTLLGAGMAAGFAISLLLAHWPAITSNRPAEPSPAAAATAPEPVQGSGTGPARSAAVQQAPAARPTPSETAAAPQRPSGPVAELPLQEARIPQPAPSAGQPAGQPAWLRHAVAAPDPGGRPMIAVVIDDLGLNRTNAARVIGLPGPLTLAFMTYAEDLERQTKAARAAGHELMVHFPMEPLGADLDSGPNALRVDLPPEELRRRLAWGLARFDGYVGVNNHMGSRFTGWEPGMAVVLEELDRRGLLFLDSRTIGNSVAGRIAKGLGMPYAGRDVFLDNEASAEAVRDRLAETEAVARRRGFAIAIGHPHDATIAALSEWLPRLAERGFALVPVSAIVRHSVAPAG